LLPTEAVLTNSSDADFCILDTEIWTDRPYAPLLKRAMPGMLIGSCFHKQELCGED